MLSENSCKVVRLANLFLDEVRQGRLTESELYNEFSLQHELACYLRSGLPVGWKVRFERPVTSLGFDSREFEKKEIDLLVTSPNEADKVAIELKFPRNGQYPAQMFAAIIDIRFLEQLVAKGLQAGLFLFLADDRRFYESGRAVREIYTFFRAGSLLSKEIKRPTGTKGPDFVHLEHAYQLEWLALSKRFHCLMVEVNLQSP